MQSVTEKWKDNQKLPLTSEGFVEITYTINDPNAKANADSSQAHEMITIPGRWNSQLVDETKHEVEPYGTLEHNLWLLDGTKSTVPNNGGVAGYAGYISNLLCDENGNFAINPYVRMSFEKKVPILPGLIITWSSILGEYPTAFRVTSYLNGMLRESMDINDNADIVSTVAFEMVEFDRIDIEVLRWATPHRRARIERIFPGHTKSYTKRNLLKFDSSQSIDLLSSSLPKYEVSFEIDNRDGAFDPLNPDGLSKYMMERQEINTRYGFKLGETTDSIEWMPGGTYYLSDWSAPQNGISASFKARDLFGFLNNKYYKGRFPNELERNGISLYTLALEVLEAANLPQRKTDENGNYKSPWELDVDALSSVSTFAPLPICTFGECLQLIANAACCTIFFNRYGILHIQSVDDRHSLAGGDEKLQITDRYSYTRPEIELTKPIKQIDVSMYSFTMESESKNVYEGTLPLIVGMNEFLLEYSEIAENIEVEGIDGMTLPGVTPDRRFAGITLYTDASKFYAKSCKLVLHCDNTGYYNIKLRGNVRKSSETIITTTTNQPSGEISVLQNVLVTSTRHAKTVGEWMKENLVRRKHLSVDWRADPKLDTGDVIMVGTQQQDMRVTSSTLSFSGAFRGSIKGVES